MMDTLGGNIARIYVLLCRQTQFLNNHGYLYT